MANSNSDNVTKRSVVDRRLTWGELDTNFEELIRAIDDIEVLEIGLNGKVEQTVYTNKMQSLDMINQQQTEDIEDLQQNLISGLSGGAPIYENVSKGLNSTEVDRYFNVPSNDEEESLILYYHDVGDVAVEKKRIPSVTAIQNSRKETKLSIRLQESISGRFPDFRSDFKLVSYGTRLSDGYFTPAEFDDLITLSRPSPKWVWNAQGQLVEVPANQPAYNHDPVTGEALGFDVEPAHTLYCSTDIENNAFAKYGDVTPVTHAKFPEGGLYEISHNPASHPTLTGVNVRVNGGVRLDTPDIRYAIVNPGDFDQIRLTIYAFESSVTCLFNFNDMTTNSGIAPPRAYADVFKSLGDGFYLVAITTPGDTNTYTRFGIGGFHSDGSPTVEGESFFMALPQVLAGDTTSSFIYNPGSTNLLREADVPVIENVDTAEWWGASEGWARIQFDGMRKVGGNTTLLLLSGGGTRFVVYTDGSGVLLSYDGTNILNSGVPCVDVPTAGIVTWSTPQDTFKILADGGSVVSSSYNGAFSGISNFNIAVDDMTVELGHLSFGKQYLSDAEMQSKIQELTS